jgi:hypothetical protein
MSAAITGSAAASSVQAVGQYEGARVFTKKHSSAKDAKKREGKS